MSIREVYPGGADNASYVELQMWAAGQNFVSTHHLVAYNSDGSVSENFALPSDVTSGANQATILIADTSYPTVFDEKPAPDASDPNLNLAAAGGAICWIEGAPPDCVAWGNFTGPLPAHIPALKVGTPASTAGVAGGKALRRSIAAGCSTLLDPPPLDDSDDSAADFAEVEPAPRNNATTPIEHACPPVPITAIDTKPANPSKFTTASFTYHAIPTTEASFECRLDAAAFASCPNTGIKFEALAEASHSFEVRAVNPTGTDPSPAVYTWTIDTTFVDETAPQTKILSGPNNPSASTSASFTYESNEAESSFECMLDGAGFTPCLPAGITYSGLGLGLHNFRVRALDSSNNKDLTPAEYDFQVVSSAPAPAATAPPAPVLSQGAPRAPLPPQTLLSKVGPRTRDRTPTFRFHSSPAGATFQCKLDSEPFRVCRSPFTTKSLALGSHLLRVRAVLAGVRDPNPAKANFRVVAP
jgi:hypothetical protein